jgi:hypothetical protein
MVAGNILSLATITRWGFNVDPWSGTGSLAVFAIRGASSPARRKVERTFTCKLG